jgi:prophage regulatory protein
VKPKEKSMVPNKNQLPRIIRKPELLSLVPLSDVTLWRLEKAGQFPRRLRLGGNSTGWLASEVEAWIEAKAAERTEAAS